MSSKLSVVVPEAPSDNKIALGVGLGISLPLAIIVIVLVLVGILIYVKKRSPKRYVLYNWKI